MLSVAQLLRAKADKRMKDLAQIRDVRVKDSNYAVARAEISVAEAIEQVLNPPASFLDDSSPEMSDFVEDCLKDVQGEL